MGHVTPTRRDNRHALRHGNSFVEFDCSAARYRVELTLVSASGLAFRPFRGSRPSLAPGTRLEGVTVRVGECVLHGDLLVRNATREDSIVEYGCLFYPDAGGSEDRWMALIAGVENVRNA